MALYMMSSGKVSIGWGKIVIVNNLKIWTLGELVGDKLISLLKMDFSWGNEPKIEMLQRNGSFHKLVCLKSFTRESCPRVFWKGATDVGQATSYNPG